MDSMIENSRQYYILVLHFVVYNALKTNHDTTLFLALIFDLSIFSSLSS